MVTFTIYRVDSNTHETTQSDRIYAFFFYLSTCNSDIRSIALLTSIIAGLYPAWYMTSFPPALMLKGNYALSAKGRLFRTLLTSFQYIISFALLVCSTFIWQQNQYMKIQDTGFARDEIVIAGLPHKGQELSQFTTFKHELENSRNLKVLHMFLPTRR